MAYHPSHRNNNDSTLHAVSLNTQSLSLQFIHGGSSRRLRTKSDLDLSSRDSGTRLTRSTVTASGMAAKLNSPVLQTTTSTPMHMNRPLSDRPKPAAQTTNSTRVNRKFWISKPHYSVFSSTGLEQMISKLDNTSNLDTNNVEDNTLPSPRQGDSPLASLSSKSTLEGMSGLSKQLNGRNDSSFVFVYIFFFFFFLYI